MNGLFRTCGWAVVACATCLSLSEAQAGGHRCGCRYHLYATPTMSCSPTPVVADSNATTDGRQRYQSAYQAPAGAPGTPVYVAPAQPYYYYNNYNNSQAVRFQDRPFEEQIRADRKIRGL